MKYIKSSDVCKFFNNSACLCVYKSCRPPPLPWGSNRWQKKNFKPSVCKERSIWYLGLGEPNIPKYQIQYCIGIQEVFRIPKYIQLLIPHGTIIAQSHRVYSVGREDGV